MIMYKLVMDFFLDIWVKVFLIVCEMLWFIN